MHKNSRLKGPQRFQTVFQTENGFSRLNVHAIDDQRKQDNTEDYRIENKSDSNAAKPLSRQIREWAHRFRPWPREYIHWV